ncbi:hypothetical protein JCM30471_31990 [Desulfuromonas carbonis]|uniref:hypothetical protein n=1 Tax=Desulfuromonas sp. DDH964 TaxID=1823759 RepID=UPI000AA97E30|nr:hypothetical protein [Desulfuromonas sp. DDH964]
MTKVETTINGELYTHKLLWKCCFQQFDAANKAIINFESSYYFELSAMLLAYLTFESYINFLGDRLAPEIWKSEKYFFNNPQYKGIDGKMNLPAASYGVSKV